MSKLGDMIDDFIMQSLLDSAYPFPSIWWRFKDKIKEKAEIINEKYRKRF